MAAKFTALFRLYRLYARMDLLWLLRDTRYFLIQVFSDLAAAAAAISGTLLIAARFGGIGGMSFKELLFMSGYAIASNGVWSVFVGGANAGNISRIIGRGQLDHNLIQPVSIPMQLMTQGFQPFSGCGMLLAGAGLTAYALAQLGVTVSTGFILLLIVSVLCSTLTVVAVSYILSCLAFFAPVAAEEISASVNDLFSEVKLYPLAGMPTAAVAFFCTLLPVGLGAWYPANVLLGRPPLGFTPLLTWVMAAAFTAAASLLFKKGMNYYARYGSTRYTGFGHR